jgi:membrane protease YdiL (CAAX protease family)
VVVVAVIGFVALSVTTGVSILIAVAPFGLATFAAALAEEAVFRRYLPDWLSNALRRTGTAQRVAVLATLLVTQLTFAVAHAENSSFSAAGPREFAILFVTGILYCGIARVGGLWAAAAFHAALNLTIAIAGYRG